MAADHQSLSFVSLDLPCLDSDLVEISQLIHDWREIAPVLGLTQTDEENIIGYPPNSVPVQRRTMLTTWTLPEIGGHGSMFPYTYIRILTAANVLRALRASRERSACSQQTSEKLSSNWKHALETRG